MKTYAYISSVVLQFSFDPDLKMRVYVDCNHAARSISAHIVDKTGLIVDSVSPEVWHSPERIISDVSRNDLSSVEEWANKIIEAIQSKYGWREVA